MACNGKVECDSKLGFADTDRRGCFIFGSSFSGNSSPRMLCFGADTVEDDHSKLHHDIRRNLEMENIVAKPAGFTCLDSSSPSMPKSNKKRSRPGSDQNTRFCPGTPAGNQKNGKKSRINNSAGNGLAKVNVKKEKLGERITALQQLVSPFGKTDTASVLHEAFGYIRFLHDQVQVLCHPYLHKNSPCSASDAPTGLDDTEQQTESETRKNYALRSKGLCLVPAQLVTVGVTEDSNGADLWPSSAMVENVSMFSL